MRIVDIDGAVVQEPAEHGPIVTGGDSGDIACRKSRSGGGELIDRARRLLEERNQRSDRFVQADCKVGGDLVAVGGSGESRFRVFVENDAVGISETTVGAAAGAAGLGDRTQEVAGDWLVHLDNNVVSLANANIEPFSGVRDNGDIVGGDDGHNVVVEVDRIHILGG